MYVPTFPSHALPHIHISCFVLFSLLSSHRCLTVAELCADCIGYWFIFSGVSPCLFIWYKKTKNFVSIVLRTWEGWNAFSLQEVLVAITLELCPSNYMAIRCHFYRGADKSLAQPGWKQANVSVRMARISFGAWPCSGGDLWQLAFRLLKLRASLTWFRACFLPGRAKDLPAPRYNWHQEFTLCCGIKMFMYLFMFSQQCVWPIRSGWNDTAWLGIQVRTFRYNLMVSYTRVRSEGLKRVHYS